MINNGSNVERDDGLYWHRVPNAREWSLGRRDDDDNVEHVWPNGENIGPADVKNRKPVFMMIAVWDHDMIWKGVPASTQAPPHTKMLNAVYLELFKKKTMEGGCEYWNVTTVSTGTVMDDVLIEW